MQRRWLVLVAVTAAVFVVGALGAAFFPGVMPATAGVGAAVGVAALLLGLAAAIASDAADLVIRGPRHVGSAGGELVAVLPRDASVSAAGPLASAVLEVRLPGHPVLLGLAAAGRDARRVTTWTDAIARALVAEGASVLHVELAAGRSELPGLVEVIRDRRRLSDVVAYEPEIKLAHLTAGRDHQEALECVNELPARLPRDLDVLLVSLPSTVSRPVVAAAGVFDHLLIVAERDRTSRVDLIAGLEALTSVGTEAQVILLDTVTALRLVPPVAPGERGSDPPARRSIASTVGIPAVLDPDEPRATLPDAAAASAAPDGDPVQPDVEVEPEPQPVAEDVREADAEAEPGPIVEVAPQPVTWAAPEPDAEVEPEPQPVIEDAREPGREADVEVETEPQPESASGPRDVDVVDAARIAAARDQVDPFSQEPEQSAVQTPEQTAEGAPDAHDEPAGPSTPDAPEASDPVVAVGPGPDGPVPGEVDPRAGASLDPGPAEADSTEDDTDRLEPVRPAPLGDPDGDPLRTTARLAILTQQIAERERDEGSEPTEYGSSSDPDGR